jgi:hypothetical protein
MLLAIQADMAATVGMYYGGYAGGASDVNTLVRINACGVQIGSSTSGGTARSILAGAAAGSATAVYFGGYNTNSCCAYRFATRFDSSGAFISAETSVATSATRISHGGAPVGTNALFYAGYQCAGAAGPLNTATRINSSGAHVGSDIAIGTARCGVAGAPVSTIGLYYGGTGAPATIKNTVTRINECAAIVGTETTAGTARYSHGMAKIGSNAVAWGGMTTFGASPTIVTNATRINVCGAIVGSETLVGTATSSHAGQQVGSVGVYYAGYTAVGVYTNVATRLNACGALVGTTTVGTNRIQHASAGL